MRRCKPCRPVAHECAATYYRHADRLRERFGAVTAVDDLSFTVSRGEIFGLVGPDGAGKTATMRILAEVHAARWRRHRR